MVEYTRQPAKQGIRGEGSTVIDAFVIYTSTARGLRGVNGGFRGGIWGLDGV